MIGVIVALVILAIFIAFIAKPLLAAFSAPGWVYQIVVGLALIIAVYLIAQALGAPVPNLSRFPEDPWDGF